MSFHLRVLPGAMCYHADTLPEFLAFLQAFGIKTPQAEVVNLACEKCGHLTTGTIRTAPDDSRH